MFQEPTPPNPSEAYDRGWAPPLDLPLYLKPFESHKIENLYFDLLNYGKKIKESTKISELNPYPNVNSNFSPDGSMSFFAFTSNSNFDKILSLSLALSFPLFEINGSVLWLSSYKELEYAEKYFSNNMSDYERSIREAIWNNRYLWLDGKTQQGDIEIDTATSFGWTGIQYSYCLLGIFEYVYRLRLKRLFPEKKFVFSFGAFFDSEPGLTMYEDRGAITYDDLIERFEWKDEDSEYESCEQEIFEETHYLGRERNLAIPYVKRDLFWDVMFKDSRGVNTKDETFWTGEKHRPLQEDF